jgi:hypothetical protein
MYENLLNLFQLNYFTGSKELVPVGWGTVDEDKTFPSLASRLPKTLDPVSDDEDQYDQAENIYSAHVTSTSSEAGSTDVEENNAPQITQTRMNEESSDEDELSSIGHINRVRLLPLTSILSRVSLSVIPVVSDTSHKIWSMNCKSRDLIEVGFTSATYCTESWCQSRLQSASQ